MVQFIAPLTAERLVAVGVRAWLVAKVNVNVRKLKNMYLRCNAEVLEEQNVALECLAE
jgi:hypothetical protein